MVSETQTQAIKFTRQLILPWTITQVQFHVFKMYVCVCVCLYMCICIYTFIGFVQFVLCLGNSCLKVLMNIVFVQTI